MKKLLNKLALFLTAICSAQPNAKFIQHLSENNLQTEHITYLRSLPASDSANYYTALYALKYQQDSLFLSNFEKSISTCRQDTLLLKKAALYFLNRDDQYSKKWFSLTASINSKNVLWKIHSAAQDPRHYPQDSLSPAVQQSFMNYKKAATKNPILAATLSAILPGSGKLYAGKKKTFLLTFLLNAAYAAQTAESAIKLGPQHPFTIINLAGFSVFYLSNIYGSYKAVKVLRHERKMQFLNDATNFYN